jgi:hypothetical protein
MLDILYSSPFCWFFVQRLRTTLYEFRLFEFRLSEFRLSEFRLYEFLLFDWPFARSFVDIQITNIPIVDTILPTYILINLPKLA